jgi:hypothetical protein
VPFDADLGPDADGQAAVVYSRCATEPPPDYRRTGRPIWGRAKGCDLYEFSFARERETKLTATAGISEFTPSIWRTRIAYAQTSTRHRVPRIYTRSLDAPGRADRWAGGPTRRCFLTGSPRRRQCTRLHDFSVAELDLRGGSVAFIWRYRGGGQGATDEMRLDRLDGRPTLVDRTATAGRAAAISSVPHSRGAASTSRRGASASAA